MNVRLITAPQPGRFLACGEHQPARLVEGDAIGVVLRSGEPCPIRSPFAGRLMGLLVLSGERVVAHQPLAWLMT